ncbi:hypothetical protein [Niveibacterium terrae]|uniref:hypothetical protein n=1 Tax=Niveibacterium terrae TaxID=3373598 RepID=UPI003A8E8B49
MKYLCVGLFLLSFLAPAASFAEPLRDDHPLIGEWKLTLPGGACEEIYRIHKDGTMRVSSAEEESESVFRISDRFSANGYFRWDDKVVKSNGKKDCTGEATPVGDEATNYIFLDPSWKMFLLCSEEKLTHCIGPFIKIKGL